MIKLAVFDIAGTTVADEDYVSRAFLQAFSRRGFTLQASRLNPLMGYRKIEAIRIVLDELGVAYSSEMVDAIHRDFEMEMIDFYEYDPEVKPLPYAEEVFLQLKEKGIHVALNTGFPRSIADAILNRFQWKERGLVDDYIASDEVANGRPEPLMIEELMRRSAIQDPQQVAKIGDTTVDVEEGRNAGCAFVVAVTTGAASRAELEAVHPTHIIDDLSELIPLFDLSHEKQLTS